VSKGWWQCNRVNLSLTRVLFLLSSKKSTISMDAVNAWFDSYIGGNDVAVVAAAVRLLIYACPSVLACADPDDDEDTINEEGILKFCEDIGVDPQDLVVLVIAWKMEAAYMCAFTRKEWQKGMQEMDCDSAAKLKAKLPQLREAIASEDEFKKFYCFCFGFSKEPGQKSLSIDIAVAMWELLLSSRFETLTASWLAFLAEKKPVKGVTRDTWDLLFDFFVKVRESYDKYDENEAWPVLIDDYMMWIDSKKK
jgi:DCN1-like protein 1/2